MTCVETINIPHFWPKLSPLVKKWKNLIENVQQLLRKTDMILKISI